MPRFEDRDPEEKPMDLRKKGDRRSRMKKILEGSQDYEEELINEKILKQARDEMYEILEDQNLNAEEKLSTIEHLFYKMGLNGMDERLLMDEAKWYMDYELALLNVKDYDDMYQIIQDFPHLSLKDAEEILRTKIR